MRSPRATKLPAHLLAGFAALAMLLAAPAAAEANWGAIAVDPVTGHYGLAYDYGSAHGAQNRARSECHTRHCQVAVYVANGWAALVQKRNNGFYFGGTGRTKHAAFAQAIRRAHEPRAKHIAYLFSGY